MHQKGLEIIVLQNHLDHLHLLEPSCSQFFPERPGYTGEDKDQSNEIIPENSLDPSVFGHSVTDGDQDNSDEHHQGMFDSKEAQHCIAHGISGKLNFWTCEKKRNPEYCLEMCEDQGYQA